MIQRVSHMVVYEPKERPYGIEALFKDDSGNWFSLSQQATR